MARRPDSVSDRYRGGDLAWYTRQASTVLADAFFGLPSGISGQTLTFTQNALKTATAATASGQSLTASQGSLKTAAAVTLTGLTATVSKGGDITPGIASGTVTWSTTDKSSHVQLANSNLDAYLDGTGTTNDCARATYGRSAGKYYFELELRSDASSHTVTVGLVSNSRALTGLGPPGYSTGEWGLFLSQYDGHLKGWTNATANDYGAISFVSGDVLRIAVDLDADKLWFGYNNTWVGSGDPGAGTNPSFTSVSGLLYPAISPGWTTQNNTVRFGASGFAYPVPSGFSPWEDAAIGTARLSQQTLTISQGVLAAGQVAQLSGLSATTTQGVLDASHENSVVLASQSLSVLQGVLGNAQQARLTGQSLTTSQGAVGIEIGVGTSSTSAQPITPSLTSFASYLNLNTIPSGWLRYQRMQFIPTDNNTFVGTQEIVSDTAPFGRPHVYTWSMTMPMTLDPTYSSSPLQFYNTDLDSASPDSGTESDRYFTTSGDPYNHSDSYGGFSTVSKNGDIHIAYTRYYQTGTDPYTYYYCLDTGSTGLEVKRTNVTTTYPDPLARMMGVCAIDIDTSLVFYPAYWNNGGTPNWVPAYQKVHRKNDGVNELIGSEVKLTSFTGTSQIFVHSETMCTVESGYDDTVYVVYQADTTNGSSTPTHIGIIVINLRTLTVASHTLTSATAHTTPNINNFYSNFFRPIAKVVKRSTGTSITQFALSDYYIVHLSWTSGTYTAPTLTSKTWPTFTTSEYANAGFLGSDSLESKGDLAYHVFFDGTFIEAGSPDYRDIKVFYNDATGTGSSWTQTSTILTVQSTQPFGQYFGYANDPEDALTWVGGFGTSSWLFDLFDQQLPNLSVKTRAVLGKVVVTTFPALSGQTLTLSGGSLKPATSVRLTGQTATISEGSLTPDVAYPGQVHPTGQTATIEQGTLTPNVTYPGRVDLTGQSLTVSQGTFQPQLSGQTLTTGVGALQTATAVTPAGQTATIGQGALGKAVVISLTGLESTVTQGALGRAAANTTTLSGQTATVGQGTPTAELAQTLTGQSLTFAQGTLGHAAATGLTGQSLTTRPGAPGTATAKGLTGLQAAIDEGALPPGLAKLLTGLELEITQGTPGYMYDSSLTLRGVDITSAVGDIRTNAPLLRSDVHLWARTEVEKLFVQEVPSEDSSIVESDK